MNGIPQIIVILIGGCLCGLAAKPGRWLLISTFGTILIGISFWA